MKNEGKESKDKGGMEKEISDEEWLDRNSKESDLEKKEKEGGKVKKGRTSQKKRDKRIRKGTKYHQRKEPSEPIGIWGK